MTTPLKVLTVFGTRPEAIKMAPVVQALRSRSGLIEARVCVTAQHRQMLDQVLDLFDIQPEWDLNLMKANQSLQSVTCEVLTGISQVFAQWRPDVVLVHGDTTTSFSTSLAAFYEKIKVAHVEAGLRTGHKYAPWPEEINRRMTAVIADYHFAPTSTAAANLLREGISCDRISVTGNTVIDALLDVSRRISPDDDISEIATTMRFARSQGRKIILVTGHRRENFGAGFEGLCAALREIALTEEIEICYPVHPNPNVLSAVHEAIGNVPHIHLIEPLDYRPFVQMLTLADVIITDSGGIQEEAPSLGKPVLVTRTNTERPEAVAAGTVRLVGCHAETIVKEVRRLLHDPDHYREMSEKVNPYGDGCAAEAIVTTLLSKSFQMLIKY